MKQIHSLEEIKKSLKKGHLSVLPTDTILGIFTDATNHDAVVKIFKTKKRDFSKPLAIFLPTIEKIQKYGIETESSKKFVKENLPGAFTILLQATDFAKSMLSPLLISSDGKIGIRIPKQNNIITLTKEVIICGTSVNISGQEFAKEEIPAEIAENVEFLLMDSSQNLSQKPSTIVDFTQNTLTVVRE
jgi:L-threonylcarbamoyladenylate synthase